MAGASLPPPCQTKQRKKEGTECGREKERRRVGAAGPHRHRRVVPPHSTPCRHCCTPKGERERDTESASRREGVAASSIVLTALPPSSSQPWREHSAAVSPDQKRARDQERNMESATHREALAAAVARRRPSGLLCRRESPRCWGLTVAVPVVAGVVTEDPPLLEKGRESEEESHAGEELLRSCPCRCAQQLSGALSPFMGCAGKLMPSENLAAITGKATAGKGLVISLCPFEFREYYGHCMLVSVVVIGIRCRCRLRWLLGLPPNRFRGRCCSELESGSLVPFGAVSAFERAGRAEILIAGDFGSS
ncbi:uncharacterized protein DS421_20g691370 [Arachis hypogaea]|nr:uncharacterized protein DS421_20g691370 [Arachis hypogaea]